MSDTIAPSPAIVKVKNPKKAVTLSGSKPKPTPSHPSTQQMVDAAIEALNERNGSSFLAIKKYMSANYNVDVEKLAPYIKRYLKGALVSGNLVQTKGKGVAGSFKLPALANKKSNANENSSKPKAITKPKDKAIAKPKSPVESKATVTAKSTAKSKATVKPKATAKPKEAAKPKATATILKEKPAKKVVKATNTPDKKKEKTPKSKNAKKSSPVKSKLTKAKAKKGGNGNSYIWCTPEDWKKMNASKPKPKGKRGGNGNKYIWCTPDDWEHKYKKLNR